MCTCTTCHVCVQLSRVCILLSHITWVPQIICIIAAPKVLKVLPLLRLVRHTIHVSLVQVKIGVARDVADACVGSGSAICCP